MTGSPSWHASTSRSGSALPRGAPASDGRVPACGAFEIEGRAGERARMRLLLALIVAILLHLLGGGMMGWHLGWIAANTPSLPPLPQPAESLRYVVLPDDLTPEEVRPEDAQSEARVSRLARTPDPVPDRPRRAADPESETERIYSAFDGDRQSDGQNAPPVPPAMPPAPRPTPPPMPRPPSPPERPPLRQTLPPLHPAPDATLSMAPESPSVDPAPRASESMDPVTTPQPDTPHAPQTPPTPEHPPGPDAPRTPPVRRIGEGHGDGGAPLPHALQSSGVRAGGRSLEVLGTRYPLFMDELVKRLLRSIAFEQQRNPLQYRSAMVVVTFRVDEAGMIRDIRFVESNPPGLLIEPAIARRVVETVQSWGALPIPTPVMLADPDFQTITLVFDFIP